VSCCGGNRREVRFAGAAFVILLTCLSGGCGRDGPERVIVTGTVTYRGEPIEVGQIRFLPTAGTEAPVSGAFIRNGKYVVDAKGGVPVGTHNVRIEARRIDPNYQPPPEGARQSAETSPPFQQYIPAKYNRETELEVTIESGSSTITKDFELTD